MKKIVKSLHKMVTPPCTPFLKSLFIFLLKKTALMAKYGFPNPRRPEHPGTPSFSPLFLLSLLCGSGTCATVKYENLTQFYYLPKTKIQIQVWSNVVYLLSILIIIPASRIEVFLEPTLSPWRGRWQGIAVILAVRPDNVRNDNHDDDGEQGGNLIL